VRKTKLIVWFIFLFSGASGLLYQVIWTRQLTLIFGSTIFAVSTVLTAFMAGLALGSFYLGRIADRETHPLRIYAFLEAGIGVFAIIFPLLLSFLNAIYILTYRGLNAEFYSLSLIRFVLSFLVLLIPSTLMGGTLPILSKFFIDRLERLGFNAGLLYALNTFGAVVGCVATGFFLIQWLGIQQSLYLGAAINLVVAIIAYWLDRPWGLGEDPLTSEPSPTVTVDSPTEASSPIETNPPVTSLLARLALCAFALSGFCALAYEVLWTRILVFFLGSTTYAFSTMLAAFLFGIAFGSFIFAWIADRVKSLGSLFGLVQLGIGLSAVVLIPVFGELYSISSAFQKTFGPSRVWTFVACVIVMVIPTLLMGASFPLVTRIYTTSAERLGRGIGDVYSVNTVGSLFGAFSAGFILIPLIGIRPSIVLMATLNTVMGCALIFASSHLATRKGRSQSVGGILSRNVALRNLFNGTAIGGVILTVGLGAIVLYTSNKPLFLKSAIFQTQRPGDTIIDYNEEVDATVTTLQDDEEVRRLYVDTNQAADASRWDSPSHRVIAHLPLLLHPAPKDALVVGFGMGVTSYSVTQHRVRVDAVEISKGVIDAARQHFSHVNNNILDNPLFNYTINDGRNHILMTQKRYDMISTGIIHPLVSAGSSNIYTADFYRLCKRILTEDGIMCQWVPLHRLPEEHYKMIVKTFIHVFPHTTLWYKYTPDFVILIGTPEPLKINYKDFLTRAKTSRIAAGLAHDDLDGMSLLDSFMMGPENIRRYVGDVPLHTDNRPRLEFFRPLDLIGTTARNIAGMAAHRERVTPYLINYGRTLDAKNEVRKHLKRYFDATQKLIQGQIAYARGEHERAIGLFDQGVRINPNDNTIRYNLRVALGVIDEDDQQELRRLEQAVKQALAKDPEDPQGHVHLAIIYERQNRLAEAADAFEQALKYNPNRPDVYPQLGAIYERQERYAEALRTYQRLEALDPDIPPFIFAIMASLYHHQDMPSKALEYAQKSLEVDANLWRGHYVLGVIYASQNEIQKALNSYQTAIKLAPNEPAPYSSLAKLHLDQKRYDDALKAIESAIRLAPNEPTLQNQRRQIQDAMQ
jgi:spermidine synthase